MAWWDELIPAQLRSPTAAASLQIESLGKNGGRRVQAHEFADVDGAWVEDSGAMPHRYDVQAFVVGDDYHVELQTLEEVLEGGGPLTFDIPTRGAVEGLWLEGEFNVEESTQALGLARVSFALVQSGAPAPLIFEALASQAAAKAAVVFARAAADFEASWSARDRLGAGTRALRRLVDALEVNYAAILAKFGPIAEVRKAIREFDQALNVLISLPRQIASQFRALVRDCNVLTAQKAKVLGRRPLGFGAPLDALGQAAMNLHGANHSAEALADKAAATAHPGPLEGDALVAATDLDALGVFSSATALAGLVESLAALELPSANAAQALSKTIAELADDVMGASVGAGPISSPLYDAVFDLKVTALERLGELRGGLPRIEIEVVPATLPLTLLAFAHGGAVGAELGASVEALLALNLDVIEDPLAIPAGTTIQVVNPP